MENKGRVQPVQPVQPIWVQRQSGGNVEHRLEKLSPKVGKVGKVGHVLCSQPFARPYLTNSYPNLCSRSVKKCR